MFLGAESPTPTAAEMRQAPPVKSIHPSTLLTFILEVGLCVGRRGRGRGAHRLPGDPTEARRDRAGEALPFRTGLCGSFALRFGGVDSF